MNLLLISFSVNHSMGDNFKMIARDLALKNDVSVITNEGISQEDLKGCKNIYNIRFDRHKPFDFINPVNYLRIRTIIKDTDYDVAFIYSPHPVNLFVFKVIDHKRLVCFVHDHILHSGVKSFDGYFLKKNLEYTYLYSRKIIVSCDFIKQDIIKRKLLTDAQKIEVNYLGLLTNLNFSLSKVEEDIDVFFFGRIEYYKGLDILISVAKQLPNVNFIIAGKGDLNAVFGISSLPSNCKQLNKYVPDKEIADCINRSKMVVLPYRDATGTQTIQSIFYYSKPVIATSVGCFPEYIKNHEDGIIIPPESAISLKNAIEELLQDSIKRKQMGENGRQKLNTIFSNENITKRYMEIFNSILN